MYLYEKDDKLFKLIDQDSGDVILTTYDLAIGLTYDKDDKVLPCTLHKHGHIDKIKLWAEDFKSKCKTLGPDGLYLAEQVRILDVKHESVEEINNCLTTTGYVDKLYRRRPNKYSHIEEANIIDD
jgi:hypothetical protein